MRNSKIGIQIISNKLKKLIVKYQELFSFKNKNYQTIYQMNYRYNNFKISDFKLHYSNLQQNHYILFYQNHFHMYIISINLNYPQNKILYYQYFYTKHLNIKANYYLNSSLLFHKMCVINNINLYTELNIYLRTNTSRIIISQPLIQSLLFGNT